MRSIINTGAFPNDPAADPLQIGFQKANANFAELYSFISGTMALTLANPAGLNSNIIISAARARIANASGGFSIGGFTWFTGGNSDGQRFHLYNPANQTMTIVNEDASSTAIYRIHTLSGSNVVLRTNLPSFATFSYDATDTRWILESTN